MEDNLSDFFNEIRAVESIQGTLQTDFEELQSLKQNLEIKRAALLAQRESLNRLAAQHEEKKLNLEDERRTQAVLLKETRQSESEFLSSINQLKNQQTSINSEIVGLEVEIRRRLEQQGKQGLQSLGDGSLAWPVPKNTITAAFHDPNYPFRYIFEHPAIDIRTTQGTPVRAAAAGYVARAKDNGLGYNYIMLLHNDKLSTVYGHVSKILVKEEEFVTQGQVIGLSGGTPGTPGAGRLTTGPHLHFEVRQQGIPVNPLLYLP